MNVRQWQALSAIEWSYLHAHIFSVGERYIRFIEWIGESRYTISARAMLEDGIHTGLIRDLTPKANTIHHRYKIGPIVLFALDYDDQRECYLMLRERTFLLDLHYWAQSLGLSLFKKVVRYKDE